MSKTEVLPTAWGFSTLQDIASSIGGGTPPKEDQSYWKDGTVPWISPKDMKSFVLQSSQDQVTEKALGRLSLIPPNSILVVVRSGILSHTFPVALNTMAGTVNQDMRAFIPKAGIHSRYLAWQLVSKGKEVLQECSKHGTTVASIEGPALARFPLAIAPSDEQTRIVEKLEELFSDLDAGVAELMAAQKKLAQYRHSLLKAAVEGALTAEWRKHNPLQETGAQLLERILKERRDRWEAKQLAKFAEQGKFPPKDWQAKYSEPVKPDTRDLKNLPEGWVWASLDQLVAESSYGTSVKCNYESNGIAVLRIPNVVFRRLDLADLKYTTQSLNLNDLEYLHNGDILVVRTNGSINLVGRAAEVIGNLSGNFYFASYLLRLRFVQTKTIPSWVSSFLASSVGRRWIEGRAASSAGQHNISLSTLLSLPIPLPPLKEQDICLEELEMQFHSIERQVQSTDFGLKQSAAQRKNILKAAFSGQLVPQDPNDEPASVLLERIRTERAERDKQPKLRKPRAAKEVA